MSLLEKFDAVVVQADNRISETDKYFCETHQEAYEAALTSFKELGFFWEDMLKTQRSSTTTFPPVACSVTEASF